MNKLTLTTIIATVFITHVGHAASCTADEAILTKALFNAIETKNKPALDKALADGASVHKTKEAVYSGQHTPLEFAARSLWSDGVRTLIAAGADVNEVTRAFTPLKYVVFTITAYEADKKQLADAEEILALLLQNGAQIDTGSPMCGNPSLIDDLKARAKGLRHEATRKRYETAYNLLTKLMNSPENQSAV